MVSQGASGRAIRRTRTSTAAGNASAHLKSVRLADSHVHLDRYPPSVVSAMLARARRAGVRHFLAIGVDLASSAAVVDLARRRRGVLAAVGVHPTRVGRLDPRRIDRKSTRLNSSHRTKSYAVFCL